ncbi:unnamed protein product [Cladocopium goreaui]|uniref:Uncharacterized protein n=1 Tax=Cladocopium goreaui TaxID=2562237 RepID=A0A9P1FS93_9DINO|nr:unnamed protein product [Cladocopium goreaui]CAI3986493.1 unnamed protein product [Cladocopium goreaui]
MDALIGKLKALSLTKFAAAAHRKLEAQDAETASCLLTDWNNARGAVQLRMQQSFGFWKDAPWSILRIGECLVRVNDDDALARSRAAARQLLHVATQRTPSTLIEARFVAPGGKLESDLLVFSQGGPLRLALRKELLSYGSVLLVLKTLEAKHFAIGIRARAGRAASVHAISADMRRQVNRDLLSDKFDECFPQLLDQLGELTTLPWQNKVQLGGIALPLDHLVHEKFFLNLYFNLTEEQLWLSRFALKTVDTKQTFSEHSVEQTMEALEMQYDLQVLQAIREVGEAAVDNHSHLIAARSPLKRHASEFWFI